MSTPSIPDASPQVLLPLILDYLESLKNNNNIKLADSESYDVALSCLKDATAMQALNPQTIPYTLEQIYSAGIQSLHNSGNTPEAWNKFYDMISSRGFFGDSKQGTNEYLTKLNAAKGKWNQKFTNTGANKMETDSSTPASGSSAKVLTDSDKKAAEQFKDEGNNYLKQQRYNEAIQSYTKAIGINNQNAIYYTNRAVVYINLKQWEQAINDCKSAIAVDTNYTKAHYRLGQAYFNNNQYKEAKTAYENALDKSINDIDMSNTIRQQLQLVNQKLNPATEDASGGGFDFSSLMNNPEIANLASQFGAGGSGGGGLDFASLMNNPAIMNMAQSMFGGGANKAPATNTQSSQPMNVDSTTSNNSSSTNINDPISQFLNSPAAQSLRSDPELAAAISDIEKNGQSAIFKYMNNPSIMNKLSGLLGSFGK